MNNYHPNKEWDETIGIALGYGWKHELMNGHMHSILKCPKGVCFEIPIFSTGKATENVARSARQKVKRCSHSPGAPSLSLINNKLDGATRLLNAAELKLEKRTVSAELEELLEEAREAVDSCASDLETRFDEAAVREAGLTESIQRLDVPGTLSENLADSRTLLAKTGDYIRDPRVVAEGLQGAKERHRAAKERLDGLLRKLSSL